MTTLPEEAVKAEIQLDPNAVIAAVRECARITAPDVTDAEFDALRADNDPLYANTTRDMERAIRAYLSALPFLPGHGAVKSDPWVDTRFVRFDDTIVFGHGGFDFDRWESLRWEMHTRHGSFAVWKSDSKTWSMYGGKYGFLMLDRFSSEEEAKAEAEQIVISLDAEPFSGACPCTTIQQDETCPVGYPSLLCETCDGKGVLPSAARDLALEGAFKAGAEWADECGSGDSPYLEREAKEYAIRSLSSPDHADAGKVEGDGWMPIESAPKNRAIQIFIPNADYYGNDGVYAGILVDLGTGQRWATFGWAVARDLPQHMHPTHWRHLPTPPSSEVAE
ncbi:hypothetical protein [Brucella tritici]|uniref:hypothetical protein n=1 Tax=Brucella tritici TaxID=94626 RepID=UPI002001C779|nr:hypothetical protein [Brucella tritici]